jgi:hypothetical protein
LRNAEEGSPNRVRTQSSPLQLKQPRTSGLCCATSVSTNTAFPVYYHYTHKSACAENHSNTARAQNTQKHKHTQNTSHKSPIIPQPYTTRHTLIAFHTSSYSQSCRNIATPTQNRHTNPNTNTRPQTHPTLTKG